MPRFAIGKPFEGGVLDELDVEQSGRIHLYGWTTSATPPPDLRVIADGVTLEMDEWFRLPRPDVASALGSDQDWLGISLGFAPGRAERFREVIVQSGGNTLVLIGLDLRCQRPDYGHLFDLGEVVHRDHIYGVGPPSPAADAQVLSLARRLPAPVLDFGCGSGALVRALRSEGIDARGIEIERPGIEASLWDDVRPYVRFYDGRFPLPFHDGEFESVVCTEVLEHIPDYAGAVREISRVARKALITVPDISAIPALFPHHVVPWHLLEGTHVNFFTQKSLEKLLSREFGAISLMRLGNFDVNGSRVYMSLVALCERRS